ncbi:uncharacterized protein LOC118438326 isoform X1 [Folsomia candida]|uniref:uncharacterized protein LOC118438326 isoform X1 n=2 Tax=Folsomia candida TaxID=158441 RepID=UPI001605467C|nr:uncharacterized protein LOC118438326 isoform X1 [Folsomia candida]
MLTFFNFNFPDMMAKEIEKDNIYSNVYCLSRFNTAFIKQFELAVKDYKKSIQPGREKYVKKSTLVHGIGTGIGGILGGIIGICFEMGPIAASSRMAGNYFHNKFQFREKAKKIVATLQNSDSSKETFYDVQQQRQNLYKILIQGATEIFVAFEEIFMAVAQHDLRDLHKIVHDAVCRIFHYLSHSDLQEFSSQSIWKGVLEGTSKFSTLGKATKLKARGHKIYIVKKTDVKPADVKSIKKNFLQKLKLSKISKGITQKVYSQLKLPRNKNAVKINSSDLFNFSGVLFLTDNNPLRKRTIYAKDEDKLDLYGCRLSFEGESSEYLERLGYKSLDDRFDDKYGEKRINEVQLDEVNEKILNDLEEDWKKLQNDISVVHQEVQNVGNVLYDKVENIAQIIRQAKTKEEINFLPYPKPDKNFTGRTELMDKIINSFTSWSNNSNHQIGFPLVDLHGLGGHGKTQTAQNIAERCLKDNLLRISGVIWIDAEEQSGIVAKIRRELENQEIQNLPENDGILLASKLYDFIITKSPQKILVIFDNVEGFEEIEKYLPFNKNVDNIAVLITSVEKIIIPTGMGEIDTFNMDILEEGEAKELAVKILNVDDTDPDISLLVSESGRIPIVLCFMARTIASVKNLGRLSYTITQFLQEMKDTSKILRYPNDPNIKDNLNLQYKKSLYTCVKIAVEKLQESNHLYAPIAIHIIEICPYFSNHCPLGYFLNHVSTIKRDIREISNASLIPLKPIEVLKNAIQLLSSFSLVNYKLDTHSKFGVEVEIHRLVQTTVGLIQEDEKRDHDILEDLIGCGDYPRSEFSDVEVGKIDEAFFHSGSIAILWSHTVKFEDLIRKYFMEKASLKKMIDHGFFHEIGKLIQILGGKNLTKKILQFEPDQAVARLPIQNAFQSALTDDFNGLGLHFIQILKDKRTDICDTLWTGGITSTVKFCIKGLNLAVVTALVEEFSLDEDFLSRKNDENQTLLMLAIICGKMDIAKYLLDKNTNPFVKGYHGHTALHFLARGFWKRDAEITNLLVTQIVSKYPTLIYEKDDDGRLPFMLAAKSGYKSVLTFLLESMTDPKTHIDCLDNMGHTALMLAIQNKRFKLIPDAIQVLLKYGADIHYRNPLSLWTAWHYAFCPEFCYQNDKISGLNDVLKILVENKVSPDLPDENGDTFLHLMMKYKLSYFYISSSDKILEFIAANNLCRIFDCKDADGLTILELAESMKISGGYNNEYSEEKVFYMDVIIDFIKNLKSKRA